MLYNEFNVERYKYYKCEGERNHRMYIYIMKWGKQKIIRTRPLNGIRANEKDAISYSYCDDLNSLK